MKQVYHNVNEIEQNPAAGGQAFHVVGPGAGRFKLPNYRIGYAADVGV